MVFLCCRLKWIDSCNILWMYTYENIFHFNFKLLSSMNYVKISFLETLIKSWCFLKCLGLLYYWHYFAATFCLKGKAKPCYAAVFCQWRTCSSEQNIKLWSVSMKQGKCFEYVNRKPPLLACVQPSLLFPQRLLWMKERKSQLRDLTRPLPKGMSYWLYFFMQLSSFCMLDVLREWTLGVKPFWVLEQISDFRVTKTECKLGT